jgi:hypothetical protein
MMVGLTERNKPLSIKAGGNNVTAQLRVYEKDYVLEFHKGFVLTEAQYGEVVGYLKTHDFDRLETFIRDNFAEDAPIVQSMLAHQKKLKKDGYYDHG